MLRPTTNRDMQVELFGERYETPLLFSPVGVQSIFHDDKETGVAAVAAEIGVPYILSTAASSTIEDVAKANGPGKRWFQLYWPHDDDITVSVSLPPSWCCTFSGFFPLGIFELVDNVWFSCSTVRRATVSPRLW